MKWKPDYLYYIIFTLCFAGFQFLEDCIRVNYQGNNDVVVYFLGITPNFLPAVGLPAAFILIISELSKNNSNKLVKENQHFLAIVISQIGLIGWEIQQVIAPYGTFDWNDILWTIIGGGVFYLIWKSMPINNNKENNTANNG